MGGLLGLGLNLEISGDGQSLFWGLGEPILGDCSFLGEKIVIGIATSPSWVWVWFWFWRWLVLEAIEEVALSSKMSSF